MICPRCGADEMFERLHKPRVSFPPARAQYVIEVRYWLCHKCGTPTVTAEQALENDNAYAAASVTAATAKRVSKGKRK